MAEDHSRLLPMRARLLLSGSFLFAVACSDSTSPDKAVPVHEVVVSPNLPELGIGDTLRLSAVVKDSAGNTLTRTVTWESSDNSKATVSSTGLVTAQDFGEAVITAAVEGKSGISTVIVQLSLMQISANGQYACGVTATGRTYCWGSNDYGELGNGDENGFPRTTPTRVATTVPMKQVTTGAYHACALSTEGAAYCWGWNIIGQLGSGTYDATGSSHPTPAAVVGGKVFTSLSAGFYHTCGTVVGGEAYCWGDNELAILGSGGTETCTLPTSSGQVAIPCGRSPRVVAGGANFASISTGSYHSCGISTTGDVHCWGDNSFGQRGLGTADTVTRFQSTLVSGGRSYEDVVSGDGFSCAVATGGQAWCWGYNEVASLGIGSGDTLPHPTPAQVVGGTGLTSLASSWYHVCGVTTTGSTLCWGLNGDGQVGATLPGTCTVRDFSGLLFDIPCVPSATQITSPVAFVSMAPALYSTCGRTAKSGVYCWGWNGYGQLGNGSMTASSVPVPVFGSPLGSAPPPSVGPTTMASKLRSRVDRGLGDRSRSLLITRAVKHARAVKQLR
jgi:alpha-tubulin suppressor-like RCC1 family protein